jgi:O-antigen/teichoic acid export membrane protein
VPDARGLDARQRPAETDPASAGQASAGAPSAGTASVEFASAQTASAQTASAQTASAQTASAGAVARGTPLGSAMAALTAARLVSVGATFLAGVVAARLLTPATLGVAGVGLTVGWAVAIVANGGLNIAAIYFLGQRADERPRIVAYVLSLCLGAAVVALVLTGAVGPVVGALALGDPAPLLFGAAAVLAAATIGYEVAGSLLLGLERRRAYVVADLLRSLATLGLTVVVLSVVRTAPAYVIATGLGVVVPAVAALLVVRRAAGSLRPRFDSVFSRDALRLGLAGQAGNVLSFVNLRLDLLLVPALLRLDLAGIYFVATRVSEVVGQVSTASAAMLFPHVAAQREARTTSATERTCRLTLVVTFGLAVLMAVVSPVLLGVLFGAAYRGATTALLILLAAMLPLALTRVIAADLKGRGRPGLVSAATGVGAVVTVVGDVALIPRHGIEGAAVASVVAYAITTAVLLGCYRRTSGGPLTALLPRGTDARDLVGMVVRLATRSTRTRRAARRAPVTQGDDR